MSVVVDIFKKNHFKIVTSLKKISVETKVNISFQNSFDAYINARIVLVLDLLLDMSTSPSPLVRWTCFKQFLGISQ